MSSLIDRLTELIHPPSMPVDSGGEESWRSAELTLGTELPHNWFQFIGRYGGGEFQDDSMKLQILNPATPEGLSKLLEVLQLESEDRPAKLPPIHPAKPGLLPWGLDDQGYTFFFWTEGHADQWPIAVGRADYVLFRCSLLEFLLSIFAKEGPYQWWTNPEIFADPSLIRFVRTDHNSKR